jgi:hypothetical protein
MAPQFNVNITQDQIIRDWVDSTGNGKNLDFPIIQGSHLSVRLSDANLTVIDRNGLLNEYVDELSAQPSSKQTPLMQVSHR